MSDTFKQESESCQRSIDSQLRKIEDAKKLLRERGVSYVPNASNVREVERVRRDREEKIKKYYNSGSVAAAGDKPEEHHPSATPHHHNQHGEGVHQHHHHNHQRQGLQNLKAVVVGKLLFLIQSKQRQN
jgi:hypothetical protein